MTPKLASPAVKVSVELGPGEDCPAVCVPRSQSWLRVHCESVGERPSQISTLTLAPTAKPVAWIVNDCGIPAAFAGTVKGLVVGVVTVPTADATPIVARTSTTPKATA